MIKGCQSVDGSEAAHVTANRRAWDRLADEHVPDVASETLTWGWWRWPEDELQIVGDIAGQAVLDLGCGAARWTVALARHGADPVGIDSSPRQLKHARRVVGQAWLELPLVLGDAERLPFGDESFDAVVCAMSFTNPYRSVSEAARVLRPGGLLAFSTSSPLGWICSPPAADMYVPETTLHGELPSGVIHFQLPYGAAVSGQCPARRGIWSSHPCALPGPRATSTSSAAHGLGAGRSSASGRRASTDRTRKRTWWLAVSYRRRVGGARRARQPRSAGLTACPPGAALVRRGRR